MSMPLYSDLNQTDAATDDKLYDVNAVYMSIHNIIITETGERLFRPEFGANLNDLLFEIIDEVTALGVYNILINAIDKWENRVSIIQNQSHVIPNYDDNAYDIKIAFKVKGLDREIYEYTNQIAAKTR